MPKAKKAKSPLRELSKNGLTWIDIAAPSTAALAALKKRYPFLLDLDLKECLPPFQRPKLLERDHYLFMVLLFPVFDRKTRTIRPAEVDLFIGRDFVITNHTGELLAMQQLADGEDPETGATLEGAYGNPGRWTYALLRAMVVACFPMLTHIANDVASAEQEIFGRFDERTVRDILRIKSNIVDFRKIMQGHKTVVRKFVDRAHKLFSLRDQEVYYEDLIGQTKEIWDFLDNDKDTIDAIYASQMSLVTFETNEALRKLAALALVIFPTTLVAAIFAMDAEHMPIRGTAYDFWIMLGVVGAVFFGTIAFLKRKKWL